MEAFSAEAQKDNLQVRMRTRFFLHAIREFVATKEGQYCLSGAGLSSYPCLFDNDALWFETALPPMVKERRVAVREIRDTVASLDAGSRRA
jgi:hypothetical protein